MTPFLSHPNGLQLAVRLQPKASRNRVEGIEERADGSQYLRVRVTAAPEKSKANKALLKLLAAQFRLPVSHMRLLAGATSRNKTVLIEGEEPALRAALAQWQATQTGKEEG